MIAETPRINWVWRGDLREGFSYFFDILLEYSLSEKGDDVPQSTFKNLSASFNLKPPK